MRHKEKEIHPEFVEVEIVEKTPEINKANNQKNTSLFPRNLKVLDPCTQWKEKIVFAEKFCWQQNGPGVTSVESDQIWFQQL